MATYDGVQVVTKPEDLHQWKKDFESKARVLGIWENIQTTPRRAWLTEPTPPKIEHFVMTPARSTRSNSANTGSTNTIQGYNLFRDLSPEDRANWNAAVNNFEVKFAKYTEQKWAKVALHKWVTNTISKEIREIALKHDDRLDQWFDSLTDFGECWICTLKRDALNQCHSQIFWPFIAVVNFQHQQN
ncbi:hypothetical protein F4777DRAFT_166618 [Nemania sp. FL0916]|nr:hypothetical protein F4777DRAFT_166618 [Nemania sp. FL0916]